MRATRLGFLVPPGNPTTEPEVFRLAPPGTTVHFTRMVAGGATGSHEGQEERNRSQIVHMEECAQLLALVKPAVIVLAHTATSYTLGKAAEAALVERIARATGIPFITAFGSVLAALALGRLVASLLYGVTPHDPLGLAGTAVVLLAVAALACLIPARRAARVDPMETLRAE